MLQLSVPICPEWTVKAGQNWPLNLRWSEAYSGIEKAALVHTSIRLGEAPGHGLPVLLYDARSKGAGAYVALAREILSPPPAEPEGPSITEL